MAGLKAEESCFPRGSTRSSSAPSSDRAPVDRDVLFQDPGSKKRPRADNRIKTAKKKRASPAPREAKTGSVTRAQILVFNKLTVGMKVLGAIQRVNEVDMVVSLPGGLTGILSLREISDLMADRVDRFVDGDASDSLENLPDLRDLFSAGQLLPCVVSRLDRADSGKHIDLTTRPSLINAFTSEAQIHPGLLVACTVVSAEPRGYLVDLGVSRGFLPLKEVADPERKLVVGQPLLTRVLTKGSAVITVSLRDLPGAKARSSWNLSLSMLTPGMLVNATVKEKLPDGYLFTFLDVFSGTADYFHVDGRELEIGAKIRARILRVDEERQVASLSIRDDVVGWKCALDPLRIGQIAEATIVAFDPLRGLILRVGDWHHAYAHISQCSDKRLTRLDKEFQIGQICRCRILAYKAIDGAFSVSLRESILSQAILSFDDVKAGDILPVTVDSVQPCGVFVHVTDHIRALCPLPHVTELRNAHSKVVAKFRPGKKVDARVLRVDPETRRVAVTFKKSLVTSSETVISSWDSVEAGIVAHGSVVTIRQDIGLFIEFYNNVQGLLPIADLKAAGFTDLDKSFYRGQVVRVLVVFADAQRQRMGLSLRVSKSSSVEVSSPIGSHGEASFVGYDEGGIHVLFGVDKEPCSIPLQQLSDHPTNAKIVYESLKMTTHESKLTVGIVGHINKSNLLGTLKPSLLAAMQRGYFARTVDDLKIDSFYHGYVMAVESYGIFVALNHELSGLCPVRYADNSFVVGQSVLGKVLEIDAEKRRCILSLRSTECKPDADTSNAFTHSYFSEIQAHTGDEKSDIDWSTFQFGNVIDAVVDIRKDFGVVCSLEPHPIKGFAMSPHNIEGVSFEIGKSVKAIILDVDRTLKIVDLNASVDPVQQRQTSVQKIKKNPKKSSGERIPAAGQVISARVDLIKDNYVILSLPDFQHNVAFALTYEFNHRLNRIDLSPGSTVSVIFAGRHESGRLLARFDFESLRTGKSSWNLSMPKVGDTVQGEVVHIDTLYATVQLSMRTKSRRIISRIWIGHVTDDTNAKPFGDQGIKVGSKITAEVVSSIRKNGKVLLGLSMLKKTPLFNSITDIAVGSTLQGFVKSISDKAICVAVSPCFKAYVHPMMVPDPCNAKFDVGDRVEATVLRVDKLANQLAASLNGCKDFNLLIVPGAKLPGRICSIQADRYLLIEVAPRIVGRVTLSEISDVFSDSPLSLFEIGQIVPVRVVSVSSDFKRVDLSMRFPDSDSSYISSISDCQVGQLVSGYIKAIGSKGCFVELSCTVTAQVRITDLSDLFIPNVESVFNVGRRVTGRIIELSPPNHIGLSLKESVVDPDSTSVISSIKTGSIVTGIISNIREFGIFVRIDNDSNSRITGMVHVSEVFDDKDEQLSLSDRIAKFYAVGDAVRARVIRVDPESKKISLSLKHSQLDLEDVPGSPEGNAIAVTELKADSDIEELDVPDVGMADPSSDEESDSGSAPCNGLKSNTEELSSSEKKSHASSRKSLIDRVRAEEFHLEKIEAHNSNCENAPESVDDFERLVLASPNSSAVWCRYIAFQLSLNETQLAREVVERALITIHYRQEAELLNIWVAYINLENLYGTSETRAFVLDRALKSCDPKKLLNRVAQMHELSGNHEECESTHRNICKRYPQSRNAWVNAASYHFRSGKPDVGRPMLKRALQALPKRKHIRCISAFALFEFKMGSAERGRTIFEGILGNYPKRVDLWSIYLDQEIRIGDEAICRRLFERVVHLDLSVKKMKFFFKRYLQYEREHGDDASVNHVKEAAKAFVASRVAS